MFKKLLPLFLFIIILIGLFIYFKVSSIESDDVQVEENIVEIEKDESDELLDSRLHFDKKIHFIYIGEINNRSLNLPILNNMVEDEVSFNDETKSIYFYSQNLAPNNDVELLVVFDVYDLDVLLHQEVKHQRDKKIKMNIPTIGKESDEENVVNNDNRLFAKNELEIEVLNSDGDISLKLGEKEYVVKVNDSQMIDKENNNVLSRLAVTNYGEWDSKNITYVLNNQD